MAVLVRTCCWGCDLKIGVLLIAIFSVIGGGYEIYSRSHKASELTSLPEKDREDPELQVLTIINLIKTDGVFNIIVVLTSLLLLGAFKSKNRFLVLPYLVWHVVLFGYYLGVTIFFIIVRNLVAIVISNAIYWVFSVYFLIVVYSFHEALREDPSGATAGYGPENPPGQVASAPTPPAVPY
ncbi:uncharacterized protein [Montipora capricornis]|uniref:uncharacterized protein isoform X1 n=1 Tax=Montipora capricornis TaxID=246305 RepID=UPI0035F14A22